MNIQETQRILRTLKSSYPHAFSILTNGDDMLHVWSEEFSNVPYQYVNVGVKNITKTSEYPPNIAQIYNEILRCCKVYLPSSVDCWSLLKKLFNDPECYNSEKKCEEYFKSLPPFVQEILETPDTLNYYLLRRNTGDEHFVILDFEKRYANVVEQEKNLIFWANDFNKAIAYKKREYDYIRSLNVKRKENEIKEIEFNKQLQLEQVNAMTEEVKEILSSHKNKTQEVSLDNIAQNLTYTEIMKYLKSHMGEYDVFDDVVLYGCSEEVLQHDYENGLSNGDKAEIDALRKNYALMQKINDETKLEKIDFQTDSVYI